MHGVRQIVWIHGPGVLQWHDAGQYCNRAGRRGTVLARSTRQDSQRAVVARQLCSGQLVGPPQRLLGAMGQGSWQLRPFQQ